MRTAGRVEKITSVSNDEKNEDEETRRKSVAVAVVGTMTTTTKDTTIGAAVGTMIMMIAMTVVQEGGEGVIRGKGMTTTPVETDRPETEEDTQRRAVSMGTAETRGGAKRVKIDAQDTMIIIVINIKNTILGTLIQLLDKIIYL